MSKSDFSYTLDFEYDHPQLGGVVVEAELSYEAAYANPDSDWETKDWLECTSYLVYRNGNLVDAHIPDDVLVLSAQKAMRELTIEHTMYENEGF